MAVTATFSVGNGTLSVFGDTLNNTVKVGRTAAGAILVNGGAVAITGDTATVANTKLIQAFGQGGDDFLTIDESLGAMPAANLLSGTGNDVLTGGSTADQLFGQAGNNTLLGKGGADFLFGGTDNDQLTGGAGAARTTRLDRTQPGFAKGFAGHGPFNSSSEAQRLRLGAAASIASRAQRVVTMAIRPSGGHETFFIYF